MCDDVFKELCDNLGADRNSERCRAMWRHLRTCADCKSLLTGLRRTIRLYKNYPVPLPSSKCRKNLFKSLGIRAL